MLLRGNAHVGHLAGNLTGGVAALKKRRVFLPREAHWWTLVLVAHVLLLLLHVQLLAELLFPALSFLTYHVSLVEHARVIHETWW